MPDPRAKRLTLIACILGSAVVFVDGTVVNVAIPAIRDDLDTARHVPCPEGRREAALSRR